MKQGRCLILWTSLYILKGTNGELKIKTEKSLFSEGRIISKKIAFLGSLKWAKKLQQIQNLTNYNHSIWTYGISQSDKKNNAVNRLEETTTNLKRRKRRFEKWSTSENTTHFCLRIAFLAILSTFTCLESVLKLFEDFLVILIHAKHSKHFKQDVINIMTELAYVRKKWEKVQTKINRYQNGFVEHLTKFERGKDQNQQMANIEFCYG